MPVNALTVCASLQYYVYHEEQDLVLFQEFFHGDDGAHL